MLYSTGENYLFFPAAGYSGSTSRSDGGSAGNYWSSTRINATYVCYLYFGSSTVYPQNHNYPPYGFPVRPVSD